VSGLSVRYPGLRVRLMGGVDSCYGRNGEFVKSSVRGLMLSERIHSPYQWVTSVTMPPPPLGEQAAAAQAAMG
jgi:hypothetical protein